MGLTFLTEFCPDFGESLQQKSMLRLNEFSPFSTKEMNVHMLSGSSNMDDLRTHALNNVQAQRTSQPLKRLQITWPSFGGFS